MTSTTAQQQSSAESNAETQAKTNEKATESSEAATPAAGEEKKTGDNSENSETNSSPAKKPTVRKTDWEQGKVYLYQFERCSSVPSVVAQCLRLETLLRVAEIPYENVDHMMRYKSANGDLPFIELNGREVADTEVIIEELSKEFKDLDADLTEAQKVISYSLQSMILNHTSWVVRCWRYKHPQEFLKTSGVDVKKTINSRVPSPLLNFMFKIGFKSNIKELIGHGIGTRNPEQVYNAGKKDLQNLSRQLGENEYFFGGKPHSLDCLAFAVLCQFIYVPFEGFDEYIKNEAPNLLRFVERVKSDYWKDWDEICKSGELNTHSPKKEGDADEAKKEEDAAAEKKKQEDLKKEKEEKKRKEKEERERKKKEEKEEKERKKREAKEKAEKEKAQKEKAAKEKSEKPGEEGGEAEATKKEETTEKGDKTEADKSETKESDAKGGDA